MARGKQIAFLFDEQGAASVTARGGKGFGLSELSRLGVPVPAGFTVTTSVARAFAQHGRVPGRLEHQLRRDIAVLEKRTGKQFGSATNPLLVSVRSGAAVSMPGMMDTILNLGLNQAIVEGLAVKYGTRFAYDCYRRFLSMFAEVVLGMPSSKFEDVLQKARKAEGVDSDCRLSGDALVSLCGSFRDIISAQPGASVPDDPWEQLQMSIDAVLHSWNNPRAVAYRRAQKIDNELGTAVNIQSMVYGNLNEHSGTGVVFSRNVATGDNELYGEYLVNAQGEDIVSGARTPLPIAGMSAWNGAVFNQLVEIVNRLELQRNDVVEIEFTVEAGVLFVLQVRNAKRTPEAAATIAAHFVWEKRWTKQEALERVEDVHLSALGDESLSAETLQQMAMRGRILAQGTPASPGVAVGTVVFSSEEAVLCARAGESVILVRPDTSPDDLEGMLAAEAIVTQTGGTTSHAAVVARSLGKPAIVGCADLCVDMETVVTVDGRSGVVVDGEVAQTGKFDKKEINLFTKWAKQLDASVKLPKLRFDMISRKVSVHQLLNDFYLVEAISKASSATKLERRSADVKARLHKEVADLLVTYLVIAVASEAQYIFDINRRTLHRECEHEIGRLREEFDADDFHQTRVDSVGAIARLKSLPHEKHVEFLQLAGSVFEVWGDVGYGGYGGLKWADIARAAENYLSGKINATVFADHAFDLQHNTGSVFGKHSMLTMRDRNLVTEQLEVKKAESDVSELYAKLMKLSTLLTDDVRSLYHRGGSLGLWQSR